MADLAEPGRRPQRAPQAGVLQNRAFRRVWLGNSISSVLRWLDIVALGIFTFDLTDDAGLVALAFLFRWLPRLVLGIPLGTLIDRRDRRRLLLSVQALQGLTAAAIATLIVTDAVVYWHVIVFALVSGVFWAAEFNLRRTLIADVVVPAHIGRAAALDWTTDSVGRMLGPGLGGGLIAFIGAEGAYFAAAGGFGLAVAAVAAVPYRPLASGDGGSRPAAGVRGAVADVVEGVRYIRTSSLLVGALVVTLILNTVFLPHASQIAVIGKDFLDAGPFAVGGLGAIEGAGSVVGSLWIAGWARPRAYTRIYVGGALLFMIAVVIFSQSESYALSAAILFLGGLGIAAFATMQTTIFTSAVAPRMRGRVLGATSLSIGAGPLAALELSVLTGPLGTQSTLSLIALQGIAALGAAILFLPAFLRGGPVPADRSEPEPDGAPSPAPAVDPAPE